MTTEIDNPYASPVVEEQDHGRPTRWRIVPAAASFLVGVVSFGIGVTAFGIMIYVLWTLRSTENLGGMIAGCSMYLGFGTSWMIGGWYYWKERYGRGLIATGIGVLIPSVLFAVLGV